MENKTHYIKISVRDLVEFILRSGDLTTSSGLKEPDAMQEGIRIHKKIQRSSGVGYHAEISLSVVIPVSRDGVEFEICLEGRADGIYEEDGKTFIDEIKGVYRHPALFDEPVPVHLAQALCYAYIYALENNLDKINIRMTYCHIPTEEIRYFYEEREFEDLKDWFFDLIGEYAKWMAWKIKWHEERDKSIKGIEFPFVYREGQGDVVKGVYQSILRKKRLYIEAPTGVGKTISTVFPSVKAMGEGLSEKIFYLTAKTITRTVAENAFDILEDNGAKLKRITITAKEKICILDKPQCNPVTCQRALGHFDRINDAVFDLLTNENSITRDTVLEYAQKHNVCPFEMCLDTSTWSDVIIGDYNYAFDPTASLKRFFANEKENSYVFLVDEAHNLVDRAREMYSAILVKEDFLDLKKISKKYSKKVTSGLDMCNRKLLELKRDCEEISKFNMTDTEGLYLAVMRLSTILNEFLQNGIENNSSSKQMKGEEREKLLDFYFRLREFLYIYELLDDKYVIYGDFDNGGNFCLHLQCMEPSTNLGLCLNKGRAAIFFSATLLPVKYYKEQLAGREDDYAIYAPSPFSVDNRLLMIGRDVSTKYTRRSPAEYEKIAEYIINFTRGKIGNYMVFFPSYKMLEDIRPYLQASYIEGQSLFSQETSMGEIEREEFLSHFQESPSETIVGLCVMGGIFGEGIDLKDNRLIGAVIVGTGLPMVCTENELFREYFDEKKGSGFSYAYRYPGMNKVLQAAGRVIRTDTDKGAILLLDGRFCEPDYRELFPREWYPYNIVNRESMCKLLKEFWEGELL